MCFQAEEKKGKLKIWESFTSGWFSFGNQAKTSITSDIEAKQEQWTPRDTVGGCKTNLWEKNYSMTYNRTFFNITEG